MRWLIEWVVAVRVKFLIGAGGKFKRGINRFSQGGPRLLTDATAWKFTKWSAVEKRLNTTLLYYEDTLRI